MSIDSALRVYFAAYFRNHGSRTSIALGLLLAAKLAGTAAPLIFKRLIDTIQQDPRATFATLVGLLIGYFALRISSTACAESRNVLFSTATQQSVASFSLMVFRRAIEMPASFHVGRQTGALTRDFDRGTAAATYLPAYIILELLPAVIEMLLVFGLLLFLYGAAFGGVVAVSISAYACFTSYMNKAPVELHNEHIVEDSRASAQACDALLNWENIKLFGGQAMEASRYEKIVRERGRLAVRYQIAVSKLRGGQAAIATAALASALLMAVARVRDGSMTVGDVVFVGSLMLQLFGPIDALGLVFRDALNCLSDIRRLMGVLKIQEDPLEQTEALPPVRMPAGDIVFDAVSFAYEPERTVLHQLSFQVPHGRKLGIVGTTGSGKSTIVRLLLGLYGPSSGAIRIGGQDIREVCPESLRRTVAVIPQDVILTNASLRDNILYGYPDATPAEFARAVRAAQLDRLAELLPAGYDTVVGERGLKLSGGERQRVAIARALLRDARIVVLDEATGALDTATEQAFEWQLRQVAAGRTNIVISHRLKNVADADAILVMEEGRIVQRGTHEVLVRSPGRYAELWALQNSQLLHEAAAPRMGPETPLCRPSRGSCFTGTVAGGLEDRVIEPLAPDQLQPLACSSV